MQDKNDMQVLYKNVTNPPLFSFNNMKCWVKLLNVHDGDTITVAIHFNDSFYKINIRLLGIDTPEIMSKDAEIKKKAKRARNILVNYLLDQSILNVDEEYTTANIKKMLADESCLIWIHLFENDKYGRALGNIYRNPTEVTSASDYMVEQKLANKYDGGTKCLTFV